MKDQTKLIIDQLEPKDTQRPVFYFDFLPVLERSKAFRHNPERLQLICEHSVRRLAPSDQIVSQENGFFLIVQSCDGTAADGLAHEINTTLLELFFGTEVFAGLGTICRRAMPGELSARGIAQPIPTKEKSKRMVSETERVEADPLARLSHGGVPGYEGLETGFLPMLNLRNEMASIFLCGAVRRHSDKVAFGAEALAGIDSRDRASLDEAILDYSLSFARRILPTKSATAIGATVSYETLAWSRGRQLYQKALRAANVADNPFFLVKIEDVPLGTPPARLAEIVAMVRPFVKRVFLELPEWDPTLLRGGHLGVAAFVAARPSGAELPALGRILNEINQVTARQQALACLTNIGGSQELALVRAAGFRFAAKRVCKNGDLNHPLGNEIPTALAA